MIAALALVLLSQPVNPAYPPRTRDRITRFRWAGDADPIVGAAFYFAPTGGSGMGAECAGTTPNAYISGTPTALTFTRASTAYCTRGNVNSVANGDLVQVASGQPRVMRGGTGSGPLGLMVENAGQNVCLRSQEFENAAWANFIAGAGTNPSKGSADTDVAPDGTTTAEKVTFNVTGAGDSSALSQTIMTAAAYSCAAYVKGNATTDNGTIDLCIDTAGAATCSPCTYNSSTWSWCKVQNVTSKASGKFYIGNASSLNGGTARAAQTPTVWGSDCETGPYATSYIPTAGASATRVLEVPSFTIGGALVNTTGSAAATVVPVGTSLQQVVLGFTTGAGGQPLSVSSGTLWATYDGTAFVVSGVSAFTTNRGWASWTGGTVIILGSSGAFDGAMQSGTTTLDVGGAFGFGLQAVVSRVCMDPSPTRCR